MTNWTFGLRRMHLASLALLTAMLLTVAACDDNDAEDAADSVSDTVEDAGDSVGDAVEDAGDAVEDAAD